MKFFKKSSGMDVLPNLLLWKSLIDNIRVKIFNYFKIEGMLKFFIILVPFLKNYYINLSFKMIVLNATISPLRFIPIFQIDFF